MSRNFIKKLSKTSSLHYAKLVFRSVLFLTALVIYLLDRLRAIPQHPIDGFARHPGLYLFIWVIFAVEMVLRFFPSGIESMGCQKQFPKNYQPAAAPAAARNDRRSLPAIAIAWIMLNGIIGVLYFTRLIDRSILLLICLAYSVCDMICILFFCPFQTWFMKNKCCVTCRIYNWDYAMMFTPLLFIPSLFNWSLLALAIALLIKWEWIYHRHPERFYEESNDALRCANCREHLCHHKTQLQELHRKLRHLPKEQAD